MELHNYTSPDSFTRVPCTSSSAYQQVSATVNVMTGRITIGFYTNDPVGQNWLRVDDVSLQ